jgi:hypothetical protein
MTAIDEQAAFFRVARVIAPLRDKAVIIGGWAHQLHRKIPLAQQVDFGVLRTEDVDIATSPSLGTSEIRLDSALEREGFRAEPSGEATPPATRYVLAERPDFYVQFLSERVGSGTRRDGTTTTTVVLAGVVAEQVRHLDLLQVMPWTVTVGPRSDSVPESVEVCVVNAASFMAQKLLILSKRSPEERAKDIVYLFDTLQVFAESLSELATLWAAIASTLRPGTIRNLRRAIRGLSSQPTDDLRRASRLIGVLPRAVRPTPDELMVVLRIGLQTVFGA